MPRGNYWEQSYKPNAERPNDIVTINDAFNGNGEHWKRIVSDTKKKATPIDRPLLKGSHITIELCDFECTLESPSLLSISNIRFKECRFDHSIWKSVKFSACTFERCHWGRVTFENCVFVNTCNFIEMSASAESLTLQSTAIPPKNFLASLKPNLRDLPDDVTRDYQTYRFASTRANLAKMVWNSNSDESNIEYYFESQEELVKALLSQRVESSGFDLKTKKYRNNLIKLISSFLPRCERRLVCAAGWFSRWGRSLTRPILIGVFCIVFFCFIWRSYAYYSGNHATYLSSLGRSLNLFLIAGYTVHIGPNAATTEKALGLLNIIFGLAWYALIVPVWLRRIIR